VPKISKSFNENRLRFGFTFTRPNPRIQIRHRRIKSGESTEINPKTPLNHLTVRRLSNLIEESPPWAGEYQPIEFTRWR